MTLRTVTYDTATHKIVPIEPTIDMMIKGNQSMDYWSNDKQQRYLANICYKTMIAAAPEYQEPTKDE